MFTNALFVALLAVAGSGEPPPKVDRMYTDGRGVLHIELDRAGYVSLCKSGAGRMIVETNGRRLTVTNGRPCKPGEEPAVSVDTAHCVISNTTVNAVLLTNCSGSD